MNPDTSSPRQPEPLQDGPAADRRWRAGGLSGRRFAQPRARFPRAQFPILTGVSAGAINVAMLANDPDPFRPRSRAWRNLWESLTLDQVFRTEFRALGTNMARWMFRLLSGGADLLPPMRGMVDTAPLRRLPPSRARDAGRRAARRRRESSQRPTLGRRHDDDEVSHGAIGRRGCRGQTSSRGMARIAAGFRRR